MSSFIEVSAVLQLCINHYLGVLDKSSNSFKLKQHPEKEHIPVLTVRSTDKEDKYLDEKIRAVQHWMNNQFPVTTNTISQDHDCYS